MSADENQASWAQVSAFIAEYPDKEYWNRWRSIVSPILQRATQMKYDSLFRAGMSMSHVIFSTLNHHGLKEEPRVTLEVMKDWNIRISLTNSNVWFREPTQFTFVSESDSFETLRRYLWHLWEETMPEAVPEILRLE